MVANRQRNLPKRDCHGAAGRNDRRAASGYPPDFCPARPAPQTARGTAASRADGCPGRDFPGIAYLGNDAALSRQAGDVTAVPANPAGIRPDGALPLGTDVPVHRPANGRWATPAPVPGATHEVRHVQP